VAEVREKVLAADLPSLLKGGLHEYIDEIQADIGELHAKIAKVWFLPVKITQTQSQSAA
jgi:hypothetical protein